MVLVALLAPTAPGCLAGEAAALSRLLPARPQRPPPGQGSARYPRRVLGRVGRCSPPRNPTRATEVYRDALGRVSVAGSPARREPWRGPAVEDGIEARDRALPLAGSTDVHHHRRPPA